MVKILLVKKESIIKIVTLKSNDIIELDEEEIDAIITDVDFWQNSYEEHEFKQEFEIRKLLLKKLKSLV